MTLFAVRDRDSLMAVRFAVSPAWETQAAVQALADERGRSYHEPWLMRVRGHAAGLELAPLLAALPRRGYAGLPGPAPADRQAGSCGRAGADPRDRPGAGGMRAAVVPRDGSRPCASPSARRHARRSGTRARLPRRPVHTAWTGLVAPFWARIRALLERDIHERSRLLSRHGLRRVLDELHPKVRWTARGLYLADGSGRTVEVGERGFLLMPSAYLWPHVAAVIERPWQPTIIYPATGIAALWQVPARPPGALGRLLGPTRAHLLACLDQPLSTTALAAMTGLSPAGVSAHLLTLRAAGLLSTARHGHEVRYHRTELGSALLRAQEEGAHVRPARSARLR